MFILAHKLAPAILAAFQVPSLSQTTAVNAIYVYCIITQKKPKKQLCATQIS